MADYALVDLTATDQVEFQLNGERVCAPPGTMLVDACAAHAVEVPIFCYEPRLGAPIGACRMCLVKVEGMRGLTTACSTPVSQDMIVDTLGPEVREAQDGVLELLLANHPLDCPVCDKGGECPLQDRTFAFGPGRSRFIEPKRHFPKPLGLSSRIALDRERCIACFRCVRFSQDVAQDGHLVFHDRGGRSEIATASGQSYEGRFTGNVIDLCPVGALTSIPYRFVARPWDVKNAPSVCSHCAVGCNTELTVRDGEIARVTGRPEPNYQVEEGWLCDKGRWAHGANRAPERITAPLLRDGDVTRAVSLEHAVAAAALLLERAASCAVLVGGKATVEEGFIAQDLAGLLANGTIARTGLAGGDLEPLRRLPGAQLGDLDAADVIAIVGGDPANQQPIIELRVRKAARRGARIICLGPRPHPLEDVAEVTRSAPGAMAAHLGRLHPILRDAAFPIVIWDELDLAGEPDAAAALARELARMPAARHLELGAEVNGAGLRALGLPAAGDLRSAIAAGTVDSGLFVHADPLLGAGRLEWEAALSGLSTVVAIATHTSPITSQATVVLPAFTPYEQEGVYVSMANRAQRLRPGARGPEGAAPGWELLIALGYRLGHPTAYRSPASAFAAAAAAHPALAGLDHATLGRDGVPLPPRPAVAPNGVGPLGLAGEGLALVVTTPIFGDRDTHLSDALTGPRTGAELVLNAREAARAEVEDGGRVHLASPYGDCDLPLRIDDEAPDGVALATAGVPGGGVERLFPAEWRPVRVQVEPASR